MDNEIETLIPTMNLRFIDRLVQIDPLNPDEMMRRPIRILQQKFDVVDGGYVWRDVPLVKTMGSDENAP